MAQINAARAVRLFALRSEPASNELPLHFEADRFGRLAASGADGDPAGGGLLRPLVIEQGMVEGAETAAAGGFTRIGNEKLVNVTTFGNQTETSVTYLTSGRFLVTWVDTNTGPAYRTADIRSQLFAADGTRFGAEILVNTANEASQFDHRTAALASGGFATVWMDNSAGVGGATGDSDSSAVKLQVFDANGTRLGSEVLVNTTTIGSQQDARVVALSGGGFVVSWTNPAERDPVTSELYPSSVGMQLFTASGARSGGEIIIDPTSPYVLPTQNMDLVSLGDGGFLAVWMSGGVLKVQMFTSSGEARAGLIPITEYAYDVDVAVLKNGNVVLAWTDASPDFAPAYGVRALVLRPDGTQAGGIIKVHSTSGPSHSAPQVAALSDGGFAVTWQSADWADDLGQHPAAVRAQVFNGAAGRVGSEIVVNEGGNPSVPVISSLHAGIFVVTWTDYGQPDGSGSGDGSGSSIKARAFTDSGAAISPEILVNTAVAGAQHGVDVEDTGGGTVAFVWVDGSAGVGGAAGDTSGTAIKLQLYNAVVPPPSDDFADGAVDDAAPIGTLIVGQGQSGLIDPQDANDLNGDKDVFKAHLLANQTYVIELAASTLPLGIFSIRAPDDFGRVLKLSGAGESVTQTFTPESDGDYYIRVGSGGASTDLGAYSLTVRPVEAPANLDDFPDYPGDTSARFPPTQVLRGVRHAGEIETAGDRDLFAYQVVSGHRYYVVVGSGQFDAGPRLADPLVTIRKASDLSNQATGVGEGRTAFSFIADFTGDIYVQVAAAGSGSGTGRYAVSVSDQGSVVVRTWQDPSAGTPLEAAKIWFANAMPHLGGRTVDYFLEDEVWEIFAKIMARMGDAEAVEVANHVIENLRALRWTMNGAELIKDVAAADDPLRALTVGIADLAAAAIFSSVVEFGSTVVGGFLGATAGGIGAPIGATVGRIVGSLSSGYLYEITIQDEVRAEANVWHDNYVVPLLELLQPHLTSPGIDLVAAAAADDQVEFDEASLVYFDADWYLATYPDAAASVASGGAGSAYAHFLSIGLDAGYRPNATQQISRSELPFALGPGDAMARGNPSLLTMDLGTHAADGLSPAETAVADALIAKRGAAAPLVPDRWLSAVAARKAADLVSNFTEGGVELALAAANSDWAMSWSGGSALTELFSDYFATLIGSQGEAERVALFVVASRDGTDQDVLVRLEAQTHFATAIGTGSFDTLGIAEYGGLWVIFLASRDPAYVPEESSPEGPVEVIVYGNEGADELYGGTRAAKLDGLAGADMLWGSSLADQLDGGDGDDMLNGGSGADLLNGQGGDDVIDGGPGQDVLNGGDGIDTISYASAGTRAGVYLKPLSGSPFGGADRASDSLSGFENIRGSNFSDDLRGDDDDNLIDGGPGNDFMQGGSGNDVYVVDSFSDFVEELEGGGTDEVRTALYGYTLARNVENLRGISDSDLLLFGNSLDNSIRGGAGNDFFSGGEGDDTIFGGLGDDFFSTAIQSGDSGADTLVGGPGDDFYDIDSIEHAVVEAAGEGTDEIRTGLAAYTLVANVEKLTGVAPHAQSLTGNTQANIITGAAFNDVLDGGGGDDLLKGGYGNDVYIVDSVSDTIVENVGDGTDEVRTPLSTYSLFGTNVENLTATSDVSHDFRGNSGGNVVTAGGAGDTLRLQDGGDDRAYGGGGNDWFLFGAALTNADVIDGGEGKDEVTLQGNYSGGVTLGAVTSIEVMVLLPGNDIRFGAPGNQLYSYSIVTTDLNVASGVQLSVDANRLRAGENLVFDGSAETDGSFYIFAGKGIDTLTGGAKNDAFLFRGPGNFTGADTVNGGAGFDELALRGDYTGAHKVVFGATTISGIEAIVVVSGHDLRYGKFAGDYSFDLTMNEASVQSGQVMIVDAGTLRSGERLVFDGSAETDGGRFTMFGGQGNDTLTGGSGADSIRGGLGADVLKGNGGADTFVYRTTADSANGAADHILDFVSGTDKIDLSRIDADSLSAGNQAFNWIGSNAFSGSGASSAGELRAYQDGASWFVEGDTNGDGTADLLIQVTGGALVQGDFLP